MNSDCKCLYMSTCKYADDEVLEVYSQIENIMEEGQGMVNTIIMGDWNSIVGEGQEKNIVGPFELGTRNERDDMLVDFFRTHLFQKQKI